MYITEDRERGLVVSDVAGLTRGLRADLPGIAKKHISPFSDLLAVEFGYE